MTDSNTQAFIQQALSAGVPQEKIAAILDRASQISRRTTKTASEKFDLIGNLLDGSDMQKTASSVAYTQGLLGEALINGANLQDAYNITKQALDETKVKLAFMDKLASIGRDPRLSQYADGFLAQAKQANITDEDAIALLVNTIDNQKQAADEGMFKSPAHSMDQAAGVEGQQGSPEEQQLLQVLQSLPPQEQQAVIQQILAAVSGGHGGEHQPAGDPTQGMPPQEATPTQA